MNKFLDLSYYKKRKFDFPNHMKPKFDSTYVGLITHYVEFSRSTYGGRVFETFHDKEDEFLLKNLISNHGIFFEKFYDKHLSNRVNNYFNSVEDFSELISLCRNYHGKDFKDRTAVQIIKQDFVRVSLNTLKSQFLFDELMKSVKIFSSMRTCEICGSQYQVINFPYWLYYGTNGNISICYECPINDGIRKSEMIPLIRDFVDECNFIPNTDFNPLNYNFSSRIPSENWIKICKIIFELGIEANIQTGSNKKINQKFGSWFKALIASDVLPDGILKTSRGIKCLAKSGNECLSLDEMFIDNWFFDNNIKTEKEPYYPKHPIYNKNGNRRADWKINEYYIEYFGLKGEESYDLKTKEKFQLAKALNLQLISIYPSDLNNLKEKLEPIIVEFDS